MRVPSLKSLASFAGVFRRAFSSVLPFELYLGEDLVFEGVMSPDLLVAGDRDSTGF